MNKLVAAAVFVVACGGKQGAKPIEGKAEGGGSIVAMDSLLTQLEAVRPFVVVKGGIVDCAAYTQDASAAIAKVAGGTAAASSERTSTAAATVDSWQRAHAPAIEKLIAEVAAPVRRVTSCEPMEKDETWRTIAKALVAVAQPAAVPAAVTQRRAAMVELSAFGAKINSQADCNSASEEMKKKLGDVDVALKSMSLIEQFIDDQVWEEEDEQQLKNDAGLAKLFETCGGM